MRRALLSSLSALLIFLSVSPPATAAEPLFKKGDVIALVGGEDMVVVSETGFLEIATLRAHPDLQLRFRNLAWEGDTVFEQRRDLNFPTLEEQLDKVGATIVIAQFGAMECFAGKDKLPAFIEAYSQLLDRMSAGGKRRLVLLAPYDFDQGSALTPQDWAKKGRVSFLQSFSETQRAYVSAIQDLAERRHILFFNTSELGADDVLIQRDGIHLTTAGQAIAARQIGTESAPSRDFLIDMLVGSKKEAASEELRQLIIAKNRLWFNYWRVQNWAFLAGDRTSQPSSRDDKDPSIRWFPPEREQFLPLIETKEKEIDALAGKLGKP